MHSKLRFFLMLTILLAGVAFVTAPGRGAAELTLREALQDELARADLSRIDAPFGRVALAACKVDADSCYSLVREMLTMRYTHHRLYSTFTVEGFGKTATCYGALTRYVCPAGVVDLQE
jgi:hypothetical protein